ncbi:hypothetical protein ZWY2020_005589 [Hordeum vulgare]|nr:hypothetical protein ZWY2020_005589 [Hordeum vulgare]
MATPPAPAGAEGPPPSRVPGGCWPQPPRAAAPTTRGSRATKPPPPAMVTHAALDLDLKTPATVASRIRRLLPNNRRLPPPPPPQPPSPPGSAASSPTTFDSQIRRHQLALKELTPVKERSSPATTRCPSRRAPAGASSPTGVTLFLLPSRSPPYYCRSTTPPHDVHRSEL